MLLATFLLSWFYPVFFEVWWNGQTPGKRATDLKVVCDDGTPVSFSKSIVRNFLRAADMLPTGYAVGLICCLIDPSFRRLGDLAAGTLVVYASPVEHQSQRSKLLTAERAHELAQILAPLAGPERTGERLIRMAAWLQGSHR